MPVDQVHKLDPATANFYRTCLEILSRSYIPFLVGGAYALARYTGIQRHTKDLDLFVREEDVPSILRILGAAGYRTERTFPHWLSKVFGEDAFIDIIHSSGNGIGRVDDGWFTHAREDDVLGVHVRLCPPEEMIWSKGFVMERERYDGADIAHLIRMTEDLNWMRLLERFGSNWQMLFSHVVLFQFIYPDEIARVPEWVMNQLLEYLRQEQNRGAAHTHLCRGTLLSREQYLVDIQEWGYQDARLLPYGTLTPEDVERWTAGIDWDKS
jgi:hypothetical protein